MGAATTIQEKGNIEKEGEMQKTKEGDVQETPVPAKESLPVLLDIEHMPVANDPRQWSTARKVRSCDTHPLVYDLDVAPYIANDSPTELLPLPHLIRRHDRRTGGQHSES